MNWFALVATSALLLVSTSSCKERGKKEDYIVVVTSASDACTFEAEGKSGSVEALAEVTRPDVRPGRRAYVRIGTRNTTLRCTGAAIYALQQAGFTDITLDENSPASGGAGAGRHPAGT